MNQERKCRDFWCCTIVLALAVASGVQPSPAWATLPTVTACQECSNWPAGTVTFSGTIAQASAHFVAGTYRITREEIWINSTRIWWKTETWNPCSGYYIPVYWCQPYSTTAWAPGTALVATAKCWTADGQGPFTATSFTAHAYNNGYSMGNTDLNFAQLMADNIKMCLTQWMNHSATSTTTDTAVDIVGSSQVPGGHVLPCTVFYAWTHGHTTEFADCPNGNWVTDLKVQAAVAVKASQGMPRLNFVFIDACHTGESQALYHAFGSAPYVGWSGCVPDDSEYANWTEYFWIDLSCQGTIAHALDYAFSEEPGVTGSVSYGNQAYHVHWVAPAV